jgi:hypothetical protein
MRTLAETALLQGELEKKNIFLISTHIFQQCFFHPSIFPFMVNQWCLPPIFWCFIPPITGKIWDGRFYCFTNIISLVDHWLQRMYQNPLERVVGHILCCTIQFRSTRCNLVLSLAKVPMSKFMGFKQGLWHEINFIAGVDTMPYDISVISLFVSL